MGLSELVKKNIYISDICSAIKRYEHNRIVHSLIRDTSEIDPIKNYSSFKDIIRYYKNHNQNEFEFADLRYSGESRLYGHLDALYKYVGITKTNYLAFPKVEHGVNPTIDAVPKDKIQFYSNFIFQSNYKKNQIHSINKLKPVFSVGPYIHYANLVYDKNEYVKIKEQFGKILLVFPFHTFEKTTSNASNEIFVNYVMNVLAKQYDTVMVSVYWNDVESKLYGMFEKCGAILVSSGFRGDKAFISRLKTLISLSDCVCGNAFGTHIGYAMYLNKPFIYINNDLIFEYSNQKFSEKQTETLQKTNQIVEEAFSVNAKNSNCTVKQRQMYDYFWGGNDCIKTQQEMEAIIKIGENILTLSHGNTSKFDNAVEYLLSDSELSEIQREQLLDSLDLLHESFI